MNRKLPTSSSISWPATALHIAVLVAGCAIAYWLTRSPRGMMWAAGIYLAYCIASRSLIAWHHRRGVRLSRGGRFAEAIPEHQASYDFFMRHAWLDRWRAITMMSSSAMSYREMALVNSAFAYSQLGNGAKAKEYYQRTLEEFPESMIAASALRLIDAAQAAVNRA